MPPRNSLKQYVENGIYHVYNRGVEKRTIFQDDQDYRVFLNILKVLLSPQVDIAHLLADVTGSLPVRLRPFQETLFGKVELLAFCLIPNHFHLLVKQITVDGMSTLMRRLATNYVMYFNKKYDRVGHLFQGTYKGVLVEEDVYLLHLSRYIHLNPIDETDVTGRLPVNYAYSSYVYYLGEKIAPWVKTTLILDYFRSARDLVMKDYFSYQSFVEGYKADPKEMIGGLSLE